MRKPKFEDGHPAENLKYAQVRTSLGEFADVMTQYLDTETGKTMLVLRHFDGSPFPYPYEYGRVRVFEHEFEVLDDKLNDLKWCEYAEDGDI